MCYFFGNFNYSLFIGVEILVYLFYHFFKGNFNQKCFYTFLYGFFQVFYFICYEILALELFIFLVNPILFYWPLLGFFVEKIKNLNEFI